MHFFRWARNVKICLDFRFFLEGWFRELECSRSVVFVILCLPRWWVRELSDSHFFLASENFFQWELSSRVVAFLVGHGMRTRFRVPTERGRRLARPQISANFDRDVQHFLI